MITTVYIDVLFLSNLIINIILLYGTGFCVNRKNSFFRSFVASSVGSVYLCVMFFSEYTILENFGFKLIISIAMMFLTFNFKELGDFIKTLIVYYILNFVLAGGIFFANSLLNIAVLTNGVVYFKTTFVSMALGIIFVSFTIGFFFYIIKKSILSKETKKEITLYYCGKKISLNIFTDTGNFLIDPLSKTSVVVVSRDKLADIINYDEIEKIKNFRIIPCQTVNCETGVLYGFKPDRLVYNKKELNATIAISEKIKNTEYDAIINPLTLI